MWTPFEHQFQILTVFSFAFLNKDMDTFLHLRTDIFKKETQKRMVWEVKTATILNP